ncbi:MAG: hypothetical protein WBB07_15345 [Mycobacterium sp.]
MSTVKCLAKATTAAAALFSAMLLVSCSPPSGTNQPPGTSDASLPTNIPMIIDESLADGWRGKTMTVIVPDSAGGNGDTWARLNARHWSKFLPGNPRIIVNNNTGADGTVATNQVFEAAGDGLTILGGGPPALPELRGGDAAQGVRFELDKMAWIGSPGTYGAVLVASKESGMTLDTVTEQSFGLAQQTAGDNSSAVTLAANEALEWKLDPKYGYDGSGERLLGLRRGEVAAAWASWPNWVDQRAEFEAGNLVPIAYIGVIPLEDPIFAGTPNLTELVPADDQEKSDMVTLATQFARWANPFIAPPTTPANMIGTLRASFIEMTEDPEYLAEAEQLGLVVDPIDGDELQAIIEVLYATPQETIDRLNQLIAAEGD